MCNSIQLQKMPASASIEMSMLICTLGHSVSMPSLQMRPNLPSFFLRIVSVVLGFTNCISDMGMNRRIHPVCTKRSLGN